MNTFNRDLVESKMNLERYSSPLRQQDHYRQPANVNQDYMVRDSAQISTFKSSLKNTHSRHIQYWLNWYLNYTA